jgi:hypothetical protein
LFVHSLSNIHRLIHDPPQPSLTPDLFDQSILAPLGNPDLYSLLKIVDDPLSLDENEPSLLTTSHYYETITLTEHISKLNKPFTLVSLNAQSIHAKIEEIRLFLHTLASKNVLIDVLCIQETWLSKSDDSSQIELENYSCFLKGKTISAHGGLAIYIRKEHTAQVLNSIDHPNYFESLFLKIGSESLEKPLMIGNIYRLPNPSNDAISNFANDFESILLQVNRQNADCILSGDFNIDLLKQPEKPLFKQYLQSIISASFVPKITLPTRFSNNSATLIDNVFLNLREQGQSKTSAGIILTKISDHQPCFLTIERLKKIQMMPHTTTITSRSPNYCENIKTHIRNFDLLSKMN